MKKTSLSALAAAGLLVGGLSVTSASAADLGGNCCADLEERIAELEATTARKGNRKVSLTVYGQVNQGVLWWDDGFESNAGVYTNDNSRTRIGFRGNAKIDSEWSAGYRLEIGVRSANSKRFTQDDHTGEAGLDLRDSHWYIDSKRLGRVTVGRGGTATDQITEINLTQTADFAKYSDVEDTGLGLSLRRTDGLLSSQYQYRRLIGVHGDQPGEGERRFDGVTYQTPTLAGFTASATWASDDYWDIALRYAGELGPFKLAAGIGYGEITDGNQSQTACAAIATAAVPAIPGVSSDADCNQFGGSISAVHQPTGLFVNFGAGQKRDNLVNDLVLFDNVAVDDKETFWALQAGIERKWTPFGNTTIYGEYYNYDGGANSRRLDAAFAGTANNAAVVSTGLESWGLGIAQGFDAAALTLYLSYRHVKGDITVLDVDAPGAGGSAIAGTASAVPLESLDLVFAGGIIKF